uniref:Uncharacterized protein n=1 Tax=Pseudomonas putida TaxID=303 RepID=A0A6B7PWR5_PSEPU|nr:hypothetical protein [Pseudomonas putida]
MLGVANGFNKRVASVRGLNRNAIAIWNHYLSHINGTRGAC